MTDENELEGQSRRKFLKTTGAVSVAATTGVAVFGGQAAAQQTDESAITDLTATYQEAEGLVVVQAVVDANLVDLVTVQVGDDVVEISDVDVLTEGIEIEIEDNQVNANVIVTALSDNTTVDVDTTQIA